MSRAARADPFYLVDLPGYGYARGGAQRLRRAQFEALTGVLQRAAAHASGTSRALLLVDARHPGLQSDRDAWRWLQTVVDDAAVVATKIDKLARGERIRAMRELESVFEDPVLPVSAVTGEGLDELWKLIDSLDRNSRNSSPPPQRRLAAATAPRPRKK